jgi:threonine/homoserine/homoserine lactone efflux protein
MTVYAWLALVPALFLLSMIPGPNNLLTAANGLRSGAARRA